MTEYCLDCTEWNGQHVKFRLFDRKKANCGFITVEASDVWNFIHNWEGDIFWNGHWNDEPKNGS